MGTLRNYTYMVVTRTLTLPIGLGFVLRGVGSVFRLVVSDVVIFAREVELTFAIYKAEVDSHGS